MMKRPRRRLRPLRLAGISLFSVFAIFGGTFAWYSAQIGRLVGQLRNSNPRTREEAARELADFYRRDDRIFGMIPPNAGVFPSLRRKVADPLLSALGDSDARVRYWSIRAMEGLNPPAPMGSLLSALADPDASVQDAAASALAASHPEVPLPLLIGAVGSTNNFERAGAMDAIARIVACRQQRGTALVPVFVAALGDPTLGGAAEQWLDSCDYRTELDALLAATSDKASSVRAAAVRKLERSDFSSESRTKMALTDLLRRRDMEVIIEEYPVFIDLGLEGSEDPLIQVLNSRGNRQMAQDFINSGNPKLDAAATRWVLERFNGITVYIGPSGPKWGRYRGDGRSGHGSAGHPDAGRE